MTEPNDSDIRDTAPEAPSNKVRVSGRDLGSSEFATAMIHLYRGEVSRSNTWRQRLDATTNWAVVTTGAALTFAFGGRGDSGLAIVFVSVLVAIFLFIEARRYRYYELWAHRARLLESNFMSPLLDPTVKPYEGWENHLVDSLREPAFPIGLLEALGRRYRRNYALLFLLLAMSWVAKIYLHPEPAASFGEFLERASAGALPGWLVVLIGVIFNGAFVALGLFTVGLRQSDAEVFGESARGPLRLWARLRAATREALETDLSSIGRSLPLRRKVLVLIISDFGEVIAKRLLADLDRGVTMIKGVGMYSGRERGILMSVVRGRRQVARLREIVHELDSNAFVVVTGVQDVRGEGFRPIGT